ncbi:hypothetical protein Cni_G22566 [Canna indica]|uniref:Uncharacterized protein n=1 Tax=Canna indica TaxID=4628 RepID=A0AAQ3KY63_9LILI|nr:hypothetical protein Cni_G22566 [Canna indica]
MVTTYNKIEIPTIGRYHDHECADVAKKCGTIESNTQHFANGTVTQSELQEVMVLLNDCDFQVMKNISSDDGLYFHEKVLFGNSEVGEKMNYGLKTFATKTNYTLSQQIIDGVSLVEEDLKFNSIFDKDAKNQISLWSLFEGAQPLDEDNQITNKTFEKKITLQELFSLTEFGSDTQHADASCCGCHNNQKSSIDLKNIKQVRLEENDYAKNDELLENLNSVVSNGNFQKSCHVTAKVPFEVTSSNQNDRDKDDPPDDRVNGLCGYLRSRSTLDEVNTYEQQFLNAHLHSTNEETVPGAATHSDQNLFFSNNHSNFHLSGCNHLSDSRSTSGHIAHPGSISFRSDSSTTSNRSFAFPILQREWNTSPIRMAKADQRRLRRNWWRLGHFCCTF